MRNDGLLKEAETMTEKSAFDKTLGELHDLIEWEDAEAAIRELHARHGLGEYAQGGKAAGCRPPCYGFGPGADSAPDGRACGL